MGDLARTSEGAALSSEQRLPLLAFAYDGSGPAKAGVITLSANGRTIGKVDHTVPGQ
jgi:hypothetical protein